MIRRPLLAALALVPAAAQAASVHVNQLGFLPGASKRAIVAGAGRAPVAWQLLDSAGQVRASGMTQPFGSDRWSGQSVQRIDFSGASAAGEGFRIRAAGALSDPFAIRPSLYAPLARDALAFFYHQRAGTPIEARFVGERWARPAGHPREVAGCIVATDSNGNRWPGCAGTLDVTSGWYDAGDHGKYVVNGGISLWTLLNLYERNALARAGAQFADGQARIPEAGNGVSDLLDEARWQLDFMMRMQVPDGRRQSVPVGARKNVRGLRFSEIDVSGMAHHKVSDLRWTGLPLRPDRDTEQRVLFPPSTAATLNLAAVTAQCARIWKTIDPAFARRCLDSATRAWRAAVRNPAVFAIDNLAGSGGYGDDDVSDEFYWAAAELLATTGDPVLRRTVEGSRFHRAPIADEPGWPAVAPLGTVTLALVPGAVSAAEQARLRATIRAAADRFLASTSGVGYAVPYAPARGYPWGSNSSLLNRAMMLALTADWSGDARYRQGVVDVMDYLLGRNPLGRSFVSGYGARPMLHPHHRFWAAFFDPAYPPPPPGVVSGGPNSTTSPRADEQARPPKGCVHQACWIDDPRSFTTNEVAINWNAPLLWVSAWLAQQS